MQSLTARYRQSVLKGVKVVVGGTQEGPTEVRRRVIRTAEYNLIVILYRKLSDCHSGLVFEAGCFRGPVRTDLGPNVLGGNF